MNRAGPETALNTDRSRERLGFEYPALCHFPESEPDGVRARLESDATVQTVGDRDLRSPPNTEGNSIGDGQRLLSAWSRQASGSVPVPSAKSRSVDMAERSKAPGCNPGFREFESHCPLHKAVAAVVQSVEHTECEIRGSIPPRSSRFLFAS